MGAALAPRQEHQMNTLRNLQPLQKQMMQPRRLHSFRSHNANWRLAQLPKETSSKL